MNRPADYIIIRFVEGNASEDELCEVLSWVEESEANTVRDDNWNSWYVLYAPMACRYIRFNINLDPTSFYWQYASWGYASVMALGIMAN